MRFLYLFLIGMTLTACGVQMNNPNRERRSTLYKGQTVWDMYENFGVPKRREIISEDEVHYIYERQEITRDWSQMSIDYCTLVVYTSQDRVIGWDYEGNQCTVYEEYRDDVWFRVD